jgi:hypothetical protein
VTEANHYQVGAAIGVILAVAGFVSSGQFVSVVGLEAPYYIVMIGAAVLRNGEAHEPGLVNGLAVQPPNPDSLSIAERTSELGAPPRSPKPRLVPVDTPQSASATSVRPPLRPLDRQRLLPELRTKRNQGLSG